MYLKTLADQYFSQGRRGLQAHIGVRTAIRGQREREREGGRDCTLRSVTNESKREGEGERLHTAIRD